MLQTMDASSVDGSTSSTGTGAVAFRRRGSFHSNATISVDSRTTSSGGSSVPFSHYNPYSVSTTTSTTTVEVTRRFGTADCVGVSNILSAMSHTSPSPPVPSSTADNDDGHTDSENDKDNDNDNDEACYGQRHADHHPSHDRQNLHGRTDSRTDSRSRQLGQEQLHLQPRFDQICADDQTTTADCQRTPSNEQQQLQQPQQRQQQQLQNPQHHDLSHTRTPDNQVGSTTPLSMPTALDPKPCMLSAEPVSVSATDPPSRSLTTTADPVTLPSPSFSTGSYRAMHQRFCGNDWHSQRPADRATDTSDSMDNHRNGERHRHSEITCDGSDRGEACNDHDDDEGVSTIIAEMQRQETALEMEIERMLGGMMDVERQRPATASILSSRPISTTVRLPPSVGSRGSTETRTNTDNADRASYAEEVRHSSLLDHEGGRCPQSPDRRNLETYQDDNSDCRREQFSDHTDHDDETATQAGLSTTCSTVCSDEQAFIMRQMMEESMQEYMQQQRQQLVENDRQRQQLQRQRQECNDQASAGLDTTTSLDGLAAAGSVSAVATAGHDISNDNARTTFPPMLQAEVQCRTQNNQASDDDRPDTVGNHPTGRQDDTQPASSRCTNAPQSLLDHQQSQGEHTDEVTLNTQDSQSQTLQSDMAISSANQLALPMAIPIHELDHHPNDSDQQPPIMAEIAYEMPAPRDSPLGSMHSSVRNNGEESNDQDDVGRESSTENDSFCRDTNIEQNRGRSRDAAMASGQVSPSLSSLSVGNSYSNGSHGVMQEEPSRIASISRTSSNRRIFTRSNSSSLLSPQQQQQQRQRRRSMRGDTVTVERQPSPSASTAQDRLAYLRSTITATNRIDRSSLMSRRGTSMRELRSNPAYRNSTKSLDASLLESGGNADPSAGNTIVTRSASIDSGHPAPSSSPQASAAIISRSAPTVGSTRPTLIDREFSRRTLQAIEQSSGSVVDNPHIDAMERRKRYGRTVQTSQRSLRSLSSRQLTSSTPVPGPADSNDTGGIDRSNSSRRLVRAIHTTSRPAAGTSTSVSISPVGNSLPTSSHPPRRSTSTTIEATESTCASQDDILEQAKAHLSEQEIEQIRMALQEANDGSSPAPTSQNASITRGSSSVRRNESNRSLLSDGAYSSIASPSEHEDFGLSDTSITQHQHQQVAPSTPSTVIPSNIVEQTHLQTSLASSVSDQHLGSFLSEDEAAAIEAALREADAAEEERSLQLALQMQQLEVVHMREEEQQQQQQQGSIMSTPRQIEGSSTGSAARPTSQRQLDAPSVNRSSEHGSHRPGAAFSATPPARHPLEMTRDTIRSSSDSSRRPPNRQPSLRNQSVARTSSAGSSNRDLQCSSRSSSCESRDRRGQQAQLQSQQQHTVSSASLVATKVQKQKKTPSGGREWWKLGSNSHGRSRSSSRRLSTKPSTTTSSASNAAAHAPITATESKSGTHKIFHAFRKLSSSLSDTSSFTRPSQQRQRQQQQQQPSRVQPTAMHPSTSASKKSSVMDPHVRLQIGRAVSGGLIKNCNNVAVVQGREAVLYHATAPSGSHDVAVKVLKRTDELGDRLDYIANDPRYRGKVPDGRREQLYMWIEKEYRNLVRANRAKVPVPTPIRYRENIIFMRFLGANSTPAPHLSDLSIPVGSHEWETLYTQAMESIRRLYNDARLVHGDLSERNIIVAAARQVENTIGCVANNHSDEMQAVLIDFGHAVDTRHPRAEMLLKDDVLRIQTFFQSRGVQTLDADEALEFVHSSSHFDDGDGSHNGSSSNGSLIHDVVPAPDVGRDRNRNENDEGSTGSVHVDDEGCAANEF